MSEKMSKWLAQRERERDLHILQSAIIKEHMNQTFVTVYAYLSLIKLMTHIHIDLPLLKIKVNSPVPSTPTDSNKSFKNDVSEGPPG